MHKKDPAAVVFSSGQDLLSSQVDSLERSSKWVALDLLDWRSEVNIKENHFWFIDGRAGRVLNLLNKTYRIATVDDQGSYVCFDDGTDTKKNYPVIKVMRIADQKIVKVVEYSEFEDTSVSTSSIEWKGGQFAIGFGSDSLEGGARVIRVPDDRDKSAP